MSDQIPETPSAPACPEFRKFPPQQVHPRLAACLYKETENLYNHPYYSQLSLPPMFDMNVLAATLRLLAGTGETPRCLNPWRSSELEALLRVAPPLVRFCWRKYYRSLRWDAYCAIKAGKTKPKEVSIDAMENEASLPSVALHDGYTTGCPYRDALQSEIGQMLLRYLLDEEQIKPERAIVLVLGLLVDETLPDIQEALTRRGVQLPAYEALRKWVARTLKEITPRLRQRYVEWGLAGADAGAREAPPS